MTSRHDLNHTLEWKECSAPDFTEEDGRLLATVYLYGIPHHLEAIPVKSDDNASDSGTTAMADNVMDAMHRGFEPDGPFCSVTIREKEYCLFLSPYTR